MPYSIECFLEIHKNMEEVLLVLEVPLAQYSQAENLFSCTASWSKPFLFLRYIVSARGVNLFSKIFNITLLA